MCNIACYQFSPLLIYIYIFQFSGTLHSDKLFFFFFSYQKRSEYSALMTLKPLFFFSFGLSSSKCVVVLYMQQCSSCCWEQPCLDSQILWKCSFHTCILVLEEALPTVFLLTKAYIFILGGLRYQFGSDFEMG